MASPDPEQPTLAHRLEYAVFRGVESLVGLLPMDICAAIGRLLGGLFQVISPKYRRLVRRNLRIATAGDPLSPKALDHLIGETFRRTGANFLTSLKSAALRPEQLSRFIETEHAEIAIRTKETGGLVAAMPHMGNWEALAKIGGLHSGSSRYGGVYRPLDNPLMDALTHQRRTADGAALFSRKDGFHAPISLLRAPGSMVVLADQRAGGRGVIIPFFGKLASCSPLPALMARRAKAEVGTLSIDTIANGRWRIHFRSIGYAPDVPTVMGALEVAMRRSLPDVFWLHDRWRIDSGRPLSFFAKVDPDVARTASVPLRLLLTTRPRDASAALAMIDEMFVARPDLHIDWLGAESHPDPRVVCHDWDRDAPAEHAGSVLARIDEAHPAPLDGVLLFGGSKALAKAARRAGLRAIIGFDVSGKPWTRSFPQPSDLADWKALAEKMARVPKSNQR